LKSLWHLSPTLKELKSRQHSVPALLVQRMGAFLLDIGLLILIMFMTVILYRWINHIPIEFSRPHYTLPHPDMGWTRVFRSLSLSFSFFTFMALLIASPLKGTPGMLAFHLQALDKNGQSIHFIRAFIWCALAFLPIILANNLILSAVAMRTPLLNINIFDMFGINFFSVLLLLQNLWFATILLRKDKKGVHDILSSVHVEHRSHHEDGLHLFRKIAYMPFLLIFIAVMCISSLFAAINLFDPPLEYKISRLANKAPPIPSLRYTWQDPVTFEISLKLNSYVCASKERRFKVFVEQQVELQRCPKYSEIPDILKSNKTIIDQYNQDMLVPRSERELLHRQYLNRESTALTDLALAQLIWNFEHNPADNVPFEKWLRYEEFWRLAIQKPGYLLNQNRAIIHYNHILRTLPIFISANPQILARYKDQLLQRLQPIDFDQEFAEGIMAYEYGLYERLLKTSLIDYFPFIQPNDTRNQFMAALNAYEDFFAEDVFDKTPEEVRKRLSDLGDQYRWTDIYNPLGMRVRDLALQNVQSNLHVLSAYHANNALKKMLLIYLKMKEQNIGPDEVPAFLENLPKEETRVFGHSPIKWDGALNALYFSPQNSQFRNHLII